MPCLSPLKGFRSRETTSKGKRKIVFNRSEGFSDLAVTVPCGQCRACRLERSRQWAVRCMHEASLWPENSFVTLTYNDDYLPNDKSVSVRELQLFLKRLRKHVPNKKIRFYACGEYGEKSLRAHYHLCLFNYDPPDKKLHKVKKGIRYYRSDFLENKIWTDPVTKESKGHVLTGDVTFESAAYVARYIMKKVNGEQAEDHYTIYDLETGEIFELEPEFTTMSRGGRGGLGGIGKGWIEKYHEDVYPNDAVIVRGRKARPPSYYDDFYEGEFPDRFRKIRTKRVVQAKEHAWNNTPERLKVRAKCLDARLNLLKRGLDDEI